MENASAAFLEAVRRSMRPIRMALGSTMIDPALLTHAERLQHGGYLRREEAYGIIRGLAKTGTPIKEIVRRTGRSRKLVRDIVRGGGGDVFRSRSNVLEPHSPGSMPNGRPAAATVPSCGGGFRKQPAFAAVFASS
jgi:transposase